MSRISRSMIVAAMIGSLLGLAGVTLTPGAASASPLCSAANITISPLHDPTYFEDNSLTPNISSHYIGYRVTNNTGAALNGAWIQLPAASFTAPGGINYITLNSGESGRDQLLNLASGASDVSYFYLTSTYTGGAADYTVAQTHSVKIWDRRPDLTGAVELCNQSDSFTRISETIQASANKVSSSVATSNPPTIGSLMFLTVWGGTGTIGSSNIDPYIFDESPATYSTWPVSSFRLEGVQTYLNLDDVPTYTDPAGTKFCVNTASGQAGNPIPAPGPLHSDLLHYNFASTVSASRCYQTIYTFRVIGGTGTTSQLSPVQEIASGQQVKHTNIDSAYASIPPIQAACPTARITKTASPTSLPMTGGTVTYTVSVINVDQSGCPAASVSLEDFVDTLPSSPAATTYVAGSSTFNGAAISDPTVSSGTATWIGPFVVPANTTRTLTYQLTLPQQHGTFVNSVIGHIGSGSTGIVDTTVATGDNVPATSSVTVPNTPPVAVNNAYQTNYNTPITVAATGVLGNDTDANGDTLTVTTLTPTASTGTATMTATGGFTYTPPANFSGNATFNYSISDGFGGTATATVTVSVGPNATNDTASTPRNTTLSSSVATNDVYASGATFTKLTGPTAGTGTVVLNSDGTYTYTPATGFTGTTSFTYQVCLASPNNTQCSTATATISVAPQAIDDAFATPYNTAVSGNILTNDLGTAPLTFVSNTAPSSGTLSTISSSGAFTYTPAVGFSGPVTFTYTMKEGSNVVSNTATVRIVVGPDAIDDAYTTTLNTGVAGNVAGNDIKPVGATYAVVTSPASGSLGATFNTSTGAFTYTPSSNFTGVDTFTYKTCLPAPDATTCDTATVRITVAPDAINDAAVTLPATAVSGNVATNDIKPTGATYAVVTSPTNGTVNAFNATTGAYTYTPAAGFYGVDTFTYKTCLSAPDGTVCDTATVSISVGPDAIDDSVATTVNTPVSGTLAGNDVKPAGSTYTKTTNPSNGSVTVNSDGTYTYTPTTGFYGTDTFTYTVCLPAPNASLCDTATVTVTIAPDAVNDTYSTTAGTAITGASVTGNDLFPVGSTFSVVTTTPNGTLSMNSSGTFTYTPNAGFSGTDTFTYKACLPTPNTTVCDTATGTITVTPRAVNDAYSTGYQTTLVVPAVSGVLANDTGTTLTVQSNTTPGNGSVTLNANGSFSYSPNALFTGVDTFNYTLRDAIGNTATATVTVVVGPNATNDTASTPRNTALTSSVAGNDAYPTGSTFTQLTGPTAGSGSLVFNSDGTYTFTPASGFTGTTTFTYKVCLPAPNATTCSTATVTINVAPQAIDDAFATSYNTPVSGNILTNDLGTGPLTFVSNTAPSSGTLSTISSTGAFTYTPAVGFSGPVTFTYTMKEASNVVSNTATVRIVVSPDAVDDSFTTTFNAAVTGNVAGNDVKPAGAGYALISSPTNGSLGATFNTATGAFTYTPTTGFTGVDTFTYATCLPAPDAGTCDLATVRIAVGPDAIDDSAVTAPATAVSGNVATNDLKPAGATYAVVTSPVNGTVNAFNTTTGAYTYTPAAGFYGVDTFTYKTCLPAPDATVCDTATVSIAVGPDAVNDTASATVNTPLNGTLTGNDLKPAGSTYTKATDPSNGTVTVNPDGSYTYTPANGFYGTDSFTYTVCLPAPNGSLCDTATVTITVGPDAVNDTYSTTTGTAITGASVTGNDLAPVGSTFTLITTASKGTLTFNADGTFDYTPNAGFSGTDTFTYQVCLPAPNGTSCDTATATITVSPKAVNDAYSTGYMATLTVPAPTGVLVNDSGVTISVQSNTTPGNGSVTLNANGSFSYTPNALFSGVDTFTYTIRDANGTTATATVSITVAPNLPPVAVPDTYTANANTSTVLPVLTNPSGLDSDPEGQTLSISAVTPPSSGGTASISGTTIVYKAPANFTGYDLFTYTISDGNGGTSTTTVKVYVGTSSGLITNDKMMYLGLGGTTANLTSAPPATGTYDRIAVVGDLKLTTQQLVIKTRDGFTPAVGDTFDIMTVTAPAKVSGAFASIYGRVLPNGVVLDVQYLNDRVRLVAVTGYFVDSTADSVDAVTADGTCADALGRCTLRAAVMQANATSGSQAVVPAPKATYTLGLAGAGEDAAATGDLDVTGPTVLVGQGATISAGAIDRVIDVRPAGSLTATSVTVRDGSSGSGAGGIRADGTLSLVDATVSNNTGASGGGVAVGATGSLTTVRGRIGANAAVIGAGLEVEGTANVDTTTIDANTASSRGGGVLAAGSGTVVIVAGIVKTNVAPIGAGAATADSAVLTLDRSTVISNTASTTGGGVSAGGATLTLLDTRVTTNTAPEGAGASSTAGTLALVRSTIDSNTATVRAAGILNGAALTISTSTLSGNVAPVGGAIVQTGGTTNLVDSTVSANRSTQGGAAAVHVVAGSVTFGNTIVADQAAGAGCAAAGGTLVSNGYNLSSDATCGFTLTGSGDVVNTTAGLGVLFMNGGYTPTHKPATTASAAYNTGPLTCGALDQRQFARPVGGRCDKGSVER